MGTAPPAPLLLPEQKQLLLEGKESEEGGTARGQAVTGHHLSLPSAAVLAAPPGRRKLGMIPDRLKPFQFWAGDGQGKGRGARAVGPPGGGRTGNAPVPGAGQGTGTAGAGPQSGSCRGTLDSSGKPGGWKSLWLSSQPSQAWCSSLLGVSNPEHQPPPDTPGTSCKSGTFVFQFSFPRTTTCSMPSLGGGCSFPLPPPTLLPAGSAPA